MIRTAAFRLSKAVPAWPLIVMTGIVMALGIALPFSPLASYPATSGAARATSRGWWAILAGYMVLTQMVKGSIAVGMDGGNGKPGGAALTGPTIRT